MADELAGLTLGGHLTLIRELDSTNEVRVYVASTTQYKWLMGVSIFHKRPYHNYDFDAKTRETVYLARLSDFGSESRQRIHPKRHRSICMIDGGFEAGLWFRAWFVNPWFVKNPYPYRRSTEHKFSRTVRRVLLEAASHCCQMCSATGGLDLDHIVPLAIGGTSTVENGLALCESCHAAKTLIQHRLLAIHKLTIQERHVLYPDSVTVHLADEPPYILRLSGLEEQQFPSLDTAWAWIVAHTQTLVPMLPEAPWILRGIARDRP
jgi:5-methylcytosine-specific restriction endonuclease McrA